MFKSAFWFRIRSVVALALLLWSAVATAQSGGSADGDWEHGSVGMTASLQGGQRDILIPLWLNQRFVIEPMCTLSSAAQKDDYATDGGVGIMGRVNFTEGRAVPYLGLRTGVLFNSTKGQKKTTDFVFGWALGGECFLDPHFSLGVEMQLNSSLSDKNSTRFANPDGTNFNTATAVLATYYL